MELLNTNPFELIELLNHLRSYLWKFEYSICYNQRLADGYNIVHTPRRKLTYGDPQAELLTSLFGDNKGFMYENLSQIFSSIFLDQLIEKKLLHEIPTGKIISLYRIIPIRNHFLLLIPFRNACNPPVYIGADSLTFQRQISVINPPRHVLDLATGSGYQLFSLPWQGNTCNMQGIDINPNAIAIANLNSQWNQTPWIQFLEGTISENLMDLQQKFDLILGNPPIIPTPPGAGTRLEGMVHANGGLDGLAVIRQIIPQIPDLLTPDGTAQFILSSLGSSTYPSILPTLETLLTENNFFGQIIAIKKIPVELDAYYRGQKDLEEYNRWMEFYNRENMNYWYRLILRLSHDKNNTNQEIKYIQLFRTEFSRPPNREIIRPTDILRRLSFYLTDTVLQSTNSSQFETALSTLKQRVHKSDVYNQSIHAFGRLLGQEFPEIFPNEGAAIRFWGQVTTEYWWKPKYQERVLW